MKLGGCKKKVNLNIFLEEKQKCEEKMKKASMLCLEFLFILKKTAKDCPSIGKLATGKKG
jgi:hypothetical protein